MSYSESILTEDYANKFMDCLYPTNTNMSHLAPSFKSDMDQDSVFTTDDVETKIRNHRDDYKYLDSPSRQIEFDDKDALNVERKYQEILKKRRTKNDSYNSPTYQTHGSMYEDQLKAQDDQSTVFDDYSLEIRHKKNEIQKDLELERHRRTRNRSTSPPGFLNDNKMRTHHLLDPLSPRETLERKVVDLDQLSNSVQKATLEHQKLCHDLQEMQNQLRKNQAEVRLSERMTQNNRERIEDVNKELKAAEHRRDQTIRQLELVTEELNLKKAKMRTLDGQVSRELAGIRRMEHYGIDRDEIETILKERDELYQIVKRQEDVQLEKYQLAKELDLVKGDFQSEQERARTHIENLEDDLEASLRMIKEIQFEKRELESHLEHLRQHLGMAENQASKSAREVSELKDEYQSKIRRKLDEYEMDKERVEKELMKLEEEKMLDETNLRNHIEAIRSDLKNTEKERKELKEIVLELEDKLRKGALSRAQIIEDQEIKFRQLENEKEETIHRLQKEITNEHRLLLEEQEIQFGHLRNKLQKECDIEVENMMRAIQIKDEEVTQLADKLRHSESEWKSRFEKEKSDFDNHMRKEKANWEQTSSNKRHQEIRKIKDDFECQMRSLRSDLEQMDSNLKDKDNQILSLKNEIADSKLENKRIVNKTMLQMKNVKEGVKQETIKQLKDRYEKKMDSELIKVISQLDKKSEAQITKVVNEKCMSEESEKRNKQILSKIVKTVAHEINEECRKIALLLNVHPRRVNHSNISDDFSKSDNIITQALANLEACGSEIRNLVEELEAKVISLTSHIANTDVTMDKEIKSIRRNLEDEKAKDIANIRDQLLKEHLREINKLAKSPDIGLSNLLREKEKEISKLINEREVWKEKAAIKLAQKFDKVHLKKINELRNLLLKREKELRQLRAIRGKSSSISRRVSRSSSALDLERKDGNLQSSPAKIIANLQDSLEKLRYENTDLRQRIGVGEVGGGRRSRLENYKGSFLNISRSGSRSRER